MTSKDQEKVLLYVPESYIAELQKCWNYYLFKNYTEPKVAYIEELTDYWGQDAQNHINKQIKEAQIEILENIRAICKSKIRNSDDWRTMADEIEKMVDGL